MTRSRTKIIVALAAGVSVACVGIVACGNFSGAGNDTSQQNPDGTDATTDTGVIPTVEGGAGPQDAGNQGTVDAGDASTVDVDVCATHYCDDGGQPIGDCPDAAYPVWEHVDSNGCAGIQQSRHCPYCYSIYSTTTFDCMGYTPDVSEKFKLLAAQFVGGIELHRCGSAGSYSLEFAGSGACVMNSSNLVGVAPPHAGCGTQTVQEFFTGTGTRYYAIDASPPFDNENDYQPTGKTFQAWPAP